MESFPTDSNPTMSFLYDPIELCCHNSYEKKKFIEKLPGYNSRETQSTNNKLITGSLIISKQLHFIKFRPNENVDLNSDRYYLEDFQPKQTIRINNIKYITFYSKKAENQIRSVETVSKSYRWFSIFCYDFRVYNFERASKSKLYRYVDFYQSLVNTVFQQRQSPIVNCSVPNSVVKSIYEALVPIQMAINPLPLPTGIVCQPSDTTVATSGFTCPPEIVQTFTGFLNSEESDLIHTFLLVCSSPKSSEDFLKVAQLLGKSTVDRRLQTELVYISGDGKNSFSSDWNVLSEKELIDCFEKLFATCTPRSKAEFKSTDKKWYSKLFDTGWLNLVQRCLQNVNILLKLIFKGIKGQQFIFLVENPSPVWSWLFTSLIRICTDMECRTILGFQHMLEKQWILSIDFSKNEILRPALFLLFLDCLYQILRYYPSSFEFSEEMLICLYDLFVQPAPGFLGSPDYDFNGFKWHKFYAIDVIDCFENQFYKPSSELLKVPDISFDSESFWFKMYTRWIPFVQIEGGSMSVRHFAMMCHFRLEWFVYANYPFSKNYDKITISNFDSTIDDARSTNTTVSDDL